jgi:DNA modification methylase
LDGGELYIEEWEKILPTLPDASVDIAFADPPYYPKKRQETHKWTDAMEIMLEYHQELHAEIKRVLKPRGSLFTFGNFMSIPCAYVAMRRVGLHVLNEIIWVRGSNPPGRGHHLERRHENVLWCTRGSRARWNFDEVKAADYPDDYFRKSKFDGRTKDIQLSDCWHFPEAPDIIEAMPIMRKTPETIGIPMKPLPLIGRLLDMVQVHGGTVLDPFAGSGRFLLAARMRNMKFTACECDKGRADLIKRRLGLAKSADAAD